MGYGQEIDIDAAAGIEGWVAESKWWKGRKVGVSVVECLLKQARQLQEKREL